MKYKIIYTKKVNKFLYLHPIIASNFYFRVNDLLNWNTKNLDIKRLKRKDNSYRLRIWDYRFLYKIIEEKIIIYFYDVGSRWDIYK
jgi:mRNA interferase RelE/StbE